MLKARALFPLLLLTSMLFAQEPPHHHALADSELGSVDFKTSCAIAVQAPFNRAVALLHSFEYDEARLTFESIAKQDPNCAMAYWGIAMTRLHGLWGEFNAPAGKAAVAEAKKLAAAPRTTARERQYIDAIAEIFSDEAIHRTDRPDNKPNSEGYAAPDRDSESAYAAKMSALHGAYPDDKEAAIFHALALDIVGRKAANDYANEKQCDDILEPLVKSMPNHPGVAHYLIHCNDSPALAQRGLAAAREYAKIAPASAHATHMPSHIFIQVGDWDSTIASNVTSLDAAEHDKDASACERLGNAQHALDFMTYGLLQAGRMADAKKDLRQSLHLAEEIPGAKDCDRDDAFPQAVYAITARDWQLARTLAPKTNAAVYRNFILLTAGLGAANTADHAGAKQIIAQLKEWHDQLPAGAQRSKDWTLVSQLWIAGADAESTNDLDAAATLYRQAAEVQERMSAVGSIFPSARQSLGEVLMRAGKAKEASTELAIVEKYLPNRFDLLYDSAQAAEKSGDRAAALAYYQKLLKVAETKERPEVTIALQRTTELQKTQHAALSQ